MKSGSFSFGKTNDNEWAACIGIIYNFNVIGCGGFVRHGRNLRRQFKPHAVGMADDNSSATQTATNKNAGYGQRKNE
jgi:hypothetical protein